MSMKRLAFITFLLFQISICFSQKELGANCEVRRVASKITIDGRQIIYTLPKNIIRIEVEITKTSQFAGKYLLFAEKYLNITEGAIQSDNEFYEISSVVFHRTSVPDSARFYSISYSGLGQWPLLQLNPDGVILGCNVPTPLQGYPTQTCQEVMPEPETEDMVHADMGVKPFLVDKTETLYKTIQTDSTPQRVPYSQTKQVKTTDNENAEAVADIIRKIRKRRLKLAMGLKDEVIDVDGKGVKTMIEELYFVERTYLELFLGKTVEKTYTYYFNFEPDEATNAEQQIVGWFSPSRGLRINKPDLRRSGFQPLILKAISLSKVPEPQIQVMDKSQKNPVPIKYGLYYRIPGRINIALRFTDRVLARQQWEIAQKGSVIPLPVDYINTHKYAIEFYPETGALKRISLNPAE